MIERKLKIVPGGKVEEDICPYESSSCPVCFCKERGNYELCEEYQRVTGKINYFLKTESKKAMERGELKL